MCGEVIDERERHNKNQDRRNELVIDTQRVDCEFTHIPVENLFQAVRLHHIEADSGEEQEHRTLNQHAANHNNDIIHRHTEIPLNSYSIYRNNKQNDSERAVAERCQPIRTAEDKLRKQSARAEHYAVKVAVLNPVGKVAQRHKEHDENAVGNENQAEQEQQLVNVPVVNGIEFEQGKIHSDNACRFPQENRKGGNNRIKLVLKTGFQACSCICKEK